MAGAYMSQNPTMSDLYANDPTITVDHASQRNAAHDVTLIWNGQDLY